MNALISIGFSSLRALYTQVITLSTIILIYHLAINPGGIDHPIATFGMYLVSWFTVVAVGMILLALTPWHPGFVRALKMVFAASTYWLQAKCCGRHDAFLHTSYVRLKSII
jgi:SNF family Na+-dependent transporter|tara:strand:+ start:196 stop:528 length:333 start_codon:yes stop_codon:yes gene_type:complete